MNIFCAGSFSKIMNCILTFMNSHLMLHSTNKVALVAAHATGLQFFIVIINKLSNFKVCLGLLQSRERQGCMVIINDYLNFGHIVLILKFFYSILQSLTKQWCIGYLKIVDYALNTVNTRAEIILANTFIFRIPRLFIFVSWPVRPARTFATTGEGTARETVPLVLLNTTGSSYCPFLPKMAPSVLMHHFFLYCPNYAFVFLICLFQQHFFLFSPSFLLG